MTTTAEPPITRQQIEDFLYEEAALLDEWRLEEWLALLTEDAAYYVPSTDVPDGDHRKDLFLVADDVTRIRSRVKQLLGRFAHAEHPHSRTRRQVGNVRIRKIEGEHIFITANFIVNRIRMEQVDTYIGRYEHILVQQEGRLKIRERRAILDLDSLRPQGKVSIIL
jgi:p-cumate 2,3-dioxygenase subunit beta